MIIIITIITIIIIIIIINTTISTSRFEENIHQMTWKHIKAEP